VNEEIFEAFVRLTLFPLGCYIQKSLAVSGSSHVRSGRWESFSLS
jgi:hypothetical protein